MHRKLFIFFFIVTINFGSANAQIYINPGVDTTDTNIRGAVKLYSSYINEFKGKRLPDFSKYWTALDCKKYKVPDLSIYGLGGDYPIYSWAQIKTILYVKPQKNGVIVLKTIGGYTDSLKRLDVLYTSINFIVKEANGRFRFISPLNNDLPNWKKITVGNVNYVYPKSNIFNRKRADSLIVQVKKLELAWELKPIQIEYFIADKFEEIQKLRGLEFTMGLGNADKPTGMANDTDNIVYCAGNGENYFHEVVHIYLNRLHPKSPLNEGVAIFYGGSMGKTLSRHANRLKLYLNNHSEINLNNLEDFYFMDNYTNPSATIQGIICNAVYKKEGLNGLKKLMKYESLNEIFEKELNFNLKNLNTELRAFINN